MSHKCQATLNTNVEAVVATAKKCEGIDCEVSDCGGHVTVSGEQEAFDLAFPALCAANNTGEEYDAPEPEDDDDDDDDVEDDDE